MATAQLVTYGDASFVNMEGSKSQCGVTVFLTHDPRRLWNGEARTSGSMDEMRNQTCGSEHSCG